MTDPYKLVLIASQTVCVAATVALIVLLAIQ